MLGKSLQVCLVKSFESLLRFFHDGACTYVLNGCHHEGECVTKLDLSGFAQPLYSIVTRNLIEDVVAVSMTFFACWHVVL